MSGPFPMLVAPKDGTRILLHYRTMRYCCVLFEHTETGDKWEECWWVSDKEKTGSDPHWEPWCGEDRTRTTDHISPNRAIEWLPLPVTEGVVR